MFGGSFYGLLVYGSPGAPFEHIDPPVEPSADTASGGAFGALLRLRAQLARPRHSGSGRALCSPHTLSGSGSFISEAQILFLLGD